jgi:UDP-N-acetyl-D-mannosaminuronic acid dehydrogenase
MKKRTNKITVVGGGGHIGLPLAIVFANKGFDVLAYDKNINPLNAAKKGKMPFMEKNGNIHLKKALKKKLSFSNKIEKFIGQSTIRLITN